MFGSSYNQRVLNITDKNHLIESRERTLNHLRNQEYEGTKNTGGITWFGSQFTGPNNKLIDPITHKANFNELPKTPVDWVTMQHDVDYYNEKNPSVDNVWELDKRAIENCFGLPDVYEGGTAVAVELLVKNALERTVQSITGSDRALYPAANDGSYHIPWFDKRKISRKVLQGTLIFIICDH